MIILCGETGPQEAPQVIKKRGNSWWVVVYTGRDPLTGKKRQKTGTAKTRAEARQLEARLIREAGTGQHRAAGNKTVAELLDRLERMAAPQGRDRRAHHARLPQPDRAQDHPGHR
jgi:Arm DNA-binding domain